MIFTAICGSIFSLLADMPRDYYPNSLEGKNGAELKTELHNLLKNHTPASLWVSRLQQNSMYMDGL